jgi:hypothetical protein
MPLLEALLTRALNCPLILKSRPTGDVGADHFELRQWPLPLLAEGEALVITTMRITSGFEL